MSLQQFMSNHNITISLTTFLPMTLQSHQDAFIMSLERLKGYSPQQQKDINLVRLHLQATTIADLSDTQDSSLIDQLSFNGTRPVTFQRNPACLRQELPSASQRRLWKRYIRSQFLRYDRYWKASPFPRRRSSAQQPPPSPVATERPTSLPILIKTLPKYQRRLLSHIKQTASDQELWEALRTRKRLTIASDGGLKSLHGSFGWNLSTKKNVSLIEGAGPIDGPYDTANSTRCELGGYTASLLILSLLTQLWGSRVCCKLRWATDSKAAVSRVQAQSDTSCPAATKQPSNADYLSQIAGYQKILRRKIRPQWIKGHQTADNTAISQTSRDIHRNNRADYLATWYRQQSTKPQSVERTDHVPESQISVILNGKRMVGQFDSSIRYHINGYHLREYLQSKKEWSHRVWNTIDVERFGAFYKRLPFPKQVAYTKFAFDQWPVGTKRYKVARIKDDNIRLCPCCKVAVEDSDHALRCDQNPARMEGVIAFRKSMSPADPNPVFRILKEGVVHWLHGTEYSPDMSIFPIKLRDLISQSLREQTAIG